MNLRMTKKRKIVVYFFQPLLLLTIFQTSCLVEKTKYGTVISVRKNERITPEGYTITKHGGFRLRNKFQLSDTSILSPSKIYKISCFDGNEWYKFFSNGRVLHAYISFDSLHIPLGTYYRCGYYSLENNNLKIELSEMETLAFGDSYSIIVIKGTLAGDTIKLDKSQWGGRGRVIEDFKKAKNKNGDPCYFIKAENFTGIKDPSW